MRVLDLDMDYFMDDVAISISSSSVLPPKKRSKHLQRLKPRKNITPRKSGEITMQAFLLSLASHVKMIGTAPK